MENPTNQTSFSTRLFYLNRILIFLFLYLAFGVLSSNAAVAVDNSSSYGEFLISGVPSLTFSHTVGNGTSRALYVGVSTANPTLGTFPGTRVSSVTYGGQALIRIGSQISPNLNNGVEIFRLINPPSGISNVVVNITATSATYAFASAVSFYGVNQTTPEGNFVSASGTSINPSVTITDSTAGDLIFDTVSSTFDAGSFLQGMDQIVCTDEMDVNTCRRGRGFFGGTSDVGATSLKNENGSSVSMSWTLANSADWAIGAFAVKAVPASAASGVIQGRVFSGDGRNVSKAIITLSGSGETFTTMTNPFGYFRFNQIPFGETYIVQVRSKQYVFAPQVITFNEDITDLNLTASGK